MTGRKDVWTSDMVFRFLEEVKKKPVVWKKSHPQYTIKYYKNIAFDEIGKVIGVSKNQAKDKLRILRTIFMQNNAKIVKSTGSRGGTVYQPKWKYYNAMVSIMDETSAASNSVLLYNDYISENKTSDSDDSDNSEKLESNKSTSTVSSVKSPTETRNSKSQIRHDSDDSHLTPSSTEQSSLESQKQAKTDLTPALSVANKTNSPSETQNSKPQIRHDSEDSHLLPSSTQQSSLESLEQAKSDLTPALRVLNKTNSPHESFAMEIVSVLNNISDENIVKRAKARMRLILAKSMVESARQDLPENENSCSSSSSSYISDFSQF